MDLAPFNIRVNALCPGVTQTPSLDRAIEEMNFRLKTHKKSGAMRLF